MSTAPLDPRTADAAANPATRVTQCRSCGSGDLREFLSLGSTPIANALPEPAETGTPDASYPLSVGFCTECALVQLTHELPAEIIFGADYPYFSSFSDALVKHSGEHVDALVAERDLGKDSLVVELASNDGYLLKQFARHGVPTLGVEPTPGPAAAARETGVETVEEFFTAALGEKLRADRGAADAILANNVMAHVPDLNGFVAGMAALVADDGVVQVENPCVGDLLEHNEFDTVYHEHFCYFSTLAVQRLFARHGLILLDVEHFPKMHGGTLRWTAGKQGTPSERAEAQLAKELAAGLDEFPAYRDFGETVRRNQAELVELLRSLRAEGASVAAYGAAAKGATLLNSSGIGANTIDFVVDRNTHKQGKLMPGGADPDPGPAGAARPQAGLRSAAGLELRRRDRAPAAVLRGRGGRFVVPVPRPKIV